MTRMDISVKRMYDTGENTRLEFFDNDKDHKNIGFINYGRDPDIVRRYVGRIKDALLQEKYRGKGIIKELMPAILCDLQCRGAEEVTLTATSTKIWKPYGFEAVSEDVPGKYVNMKRPLKETKCKCKCSVENLLTKKSGPISYDETYK